MANKIIFATNADQVERKINDLGDSLNRAAKENKDIAGSTNKAEREFKQAAQAAKKYDRALDGIKGGGRMGAPMGGAPKAGGLFGGIENKAEGASEALGALSKAGGDAGGLVGDFGDAIGSASPVIGALAVVGGFAAVGLDRMATRIESNIAAVTALAQAENEAKDQIISAAKERAATSLTEFEAFSEIAQKAPLVGLSFEELMTRAKEIADATPVSTLRDVARAEIEFRKKFGDDAEKALNLAINAEKRGVATINEAMDKISTKMLRGDLLPALDKLAQEFGFAKNAINNSLIGYNEAVMDLTKLSKLQTNVDSMKVEEGRQQVDSIDQSIEQIRRFEDAAAEATRLNQKYSRQLERVEKLSRQLVEIQNNANAGALIPGTESYEEAGLLSEALRLAKENLKNFGKEAEEQERKVIELRPRAEARALADRFELLSGRGQVLEKYDKMSNQLEILNARLDEINKNLPSQIWEWFRSLGGESPLQETVREIQGVRRAVETLQEGRQ